MMVGQDDGLSVQYLVRLVLRIPPCLNHSLFTCVHRNQIHVLTVPCWQPYQTDGCNKMDCSRCRCIFCYLCGKEIKLKDPYGHFSAECRLFEGMPGVEDDGEW
eukprot:m.118171 g.118171  ORF g.118171 m.118171 type:complete len:103 (+) comp10966_c0_seq1:1689-1997(+)